MEKIYRIFISHSWSYSEDYDKIEEFLDQEGVKYYNHSVPKDDPVHTNGTDKELYAAIEAKIKGCSCVIILDGVYSSYSKWINKEIKIAQEYNVSFDFKGKTTYDALGCEKCNNTGYFERIGIFEVLIIDENIKKLIVNNDPSIEIRNEALKFGYKPLIIDGLQKVVDGITTLKELNSKLAIY